MGESIIMPRDIRIEAITKSITRNGIKIKKPISEPEAKEAIKSTEKKIIDKEEKKSVAS